MTEQTATAALRTVTRALFFYDIDDASVIYRKLAGGELEQLADTNDGEQWYPADHIDPEYLAPLSDDKALAVVRRVVPRR